nr:hypothetical protein [Tanacetum cinerariifolium]
MESTSDDDQNINPSISKTVASPSTISPKPFIKFVKAVDRSAERSTTNKVETVKKPVVRYVELYKKPSKKSIVRGNQMNWNNLKSQQLGVKRGTTRPQNNTHKSMPPRPAIHRPYKPPMRTTRPNTNAATRPYVNSARLQTTQELMIILIQRFQRLERELKARTPVHKVDRGRSKPVMAWVPKKKLDCRCNIKFMGGLLRIKCSKIFPPSVMNSHCQKKFPLLEEVPTTRVILPLDYSVEQSPCLTRQKILIQFQHIRVSMSIPRRDRLTLVGKALVLIFQAVMFTLLGTCSTNVIGKRD